MIFPRSFARKIAPPLKYAPHVSSPEVQRGDEVVDPRDRAAQPLRGRPDEPPRRARVEPRERDRLEPAEAGAGLGEALELAAGADLHAHERPARRQQGRVDPLGGDAQALDAPDLARAQVGERALEGGRPQQRAGAEPGRRVRRRRRAPRPTGS